jgi:hypothetical protein
MQVEGLNVTGVRRANRFKVELMGNARFTNEWSRSQSSSWLDGGEERLTV